MKNKQKNTAHKYSRKSCVYRFNLLFPQENIYFYTTRGTGGDYNRQ